MDINSLSSQKIDWKSLPQNELKGKRGSSVYKETMSGEFKIRLAEYSANYESAAVCGKGHIIHCIGGKFTLHLKNGNEIRLKEGDSIILGSGDPHTATTNDDSAVLFIIDNS